MMTTLVRGALASDVEALIDLSVRTIRASYPPVLGDPMVEDYLASGAAERYVRENVDGCSVILEGDRVVGFAVCRDELIDLMMIDHAMHRRGFGTVLLRWVEAQLGRRYDLLRLESFEANHPANAFYGKNGWVEVERYFDGGAGVRKVVFRKAVG